MTSTTVTRVHWSFWVIGAIALIWNLLGCVNFVVQMNPDMVAAYRATEQAIIHGRPAWATGAFALAVFGGAAGCVLLLFRRSAAIYLFVASLLGVIATTIHTLGVGLDFGLGEILGIILMPLVVSGFLIWYARRAASKGWIG